MRSKDSVQKGINGACALAQLSISIHTENGLQVNNERWKSGHKIQYIYVKYLDHQATKSLCFVFIPHILFGDSYPSFSLQTTIHIIITAIHLCKCPHRYFIYGLQDAQHLERVKLEFQMFEIQKGEHKDKDKEYVLHLLSVEIIRLPTSICTWVSSSCIFNQWWLSFLYCMHGHSAARTHKPTSNEPDRIAPMATSKSI